MQIRIRGLSRAAPETVQRAMHAFADPIENMGISDSVPVGAPQAACAPESLHLWLQKSESAMGNIYYRSQIYKKNYLGKRGVVS